MVEPRVRPWDERPYYAQILPRRRRFGGAPVLVLFAVLVAAAFGGWALHVAW